MSCDVLCDTPFEACVEQGGTFRYTATLKDEDEVVIPLTDVDTLTLRLTNKADGAVINERDDVDILNTDIGTYHATSGLLTVQFAAADNPITAAGEFLRKEEHVATFTLTLTNGKVKRWPVLITVDNLDKLAGSAPDED